eukprot:gnl/MRDRNA2_/MRDRNA2_115686_c0_seq1.p1 gnl/MRDRNA2_/MRDRNA2_115686_c0~~gnl/MRDRNA2_/MRDRNA2_115686_c0_seq1.p1  ORF type:complete len:474 (-),score=66.53 gnl/MRDRNA2_/MRDRNA2_115686_c0_seq1:181-1602(-)
MKRSLASLDMDEPETILYPTSPQPPAMVSARQSTEHSLSFALGSSQSSTWMPPEPTPSVRRPEKRQATAEHLEALDLDEPDQLLHHGSMSQGVQTPGHNQRANESLKFSYPTINSFQASFPAAPTPAAQSPPQALKHPGSASAPSMQSAPAQHHQGHAPNTSWHAPAVRSQPQERMQSQLQGLKHSGSSPESVMLPARHAVSSAFAQRSQESKNGPPAQQSLPPWPPRHSKLQGSSASSRPVSSPNQPWLCPSPSQNQINREIGAQGKNRMMDPWGALDQQGVNESLEMGLRLEDQQGPPGPAGRQLALEWPTATPRSDETRSFCLWKHGAWMRALQALDLPLDDWHTGKGLSTDLSKTSWLRDQNLAAVKAHCETRSHRKWHLLVLVRNLRSQCGEVELTVCDPTSQMEAFVDHRVLGKWPDAIREGTALVLQNAFVVHPKPNSWQLVITTGSLVQPFAPETLHEGRNSCRL